MPAVSKAQFEWAHAAYKRGEIDEKTRDEFVEGVNYDKLPEHVEDKNSARRGRLKALDKHLAKLRGRLKRT
jgi:hypothetical protein